MHILNKFKCLLWFCVLHMHFVIKTSKTIRATKSLLATTILETLWQLQSVDIPFDLTGHIMEHLTTSRQRHLLSFTHVI